MKRLKADAPVPEQQLSYKHLSEYVGTWTYPKKACNVKHLFDPNETRKYIEKEQFNCSASELLTLVPILLCFFVRVAAPRGHAAAEVASIILCLNVVQLLMCTRKTGQVSAAQLYKTITDHLSSFLEAYGEDYWRPKHHYSLHLPRMLAFFGLLLACFVHERKHQLPKRFTKDRHNTTSYETGAIEEITVLHINELERMHAVGILPLMREPYRRQQQLLKDIFPGCDEFHVAPFSVCDYQEVHVGDVAFFTSSGARCCGEVLLHVCASGNAYTIISMWRSTTAGPDANAHMARYEVPATSRVVAVPSGDVLCPLIYSRSGSNVGVLIPPEHR